LRILEVFQRYFRGFLNEQEMQEELRKICGVFLAVAPFFSQGVWINGLGDTGRRSSSMWHVPLGRWLLGGIFLPYILF